ncbi:hypothetical protein FQN60_018424, partial [Etheostoma spectabile]
RASSKLSTTFGDLGGWNSSSLSRGQQPSCRQNSVIPPRLGLLHSTPESLFASTNNDERDKLRRFYVSTA